MAMLRETQSSCETFPEFHGTSGPIAATIRSLEHETEALKSFAFPPLKPAIANHLRPSRSGREMAALLSDPQIRAAVFGPDVPEG
jgi:hypothetical protein